MVAIQQAYACAIKNHIGLLSKSLEVVGHYLCAETKDLTNSFKHRRSTWYLIEQFHIVYEIVELESFYGLARAVET